MELIYQNTTMKIIKKAVKCFCLLLMLLLFWTASGCGREMEETKAEKTEEAEKKEETYVSEKEADKQASPEAEQAEDLQAQEQEEVSEAETQEPVTMAQLMGGGDGNAEDEDAETLPDTVLWFNASYAPVTYSNAWNWKLVGGLKPTEENKELDQYLLLSSWSIRDRESALETVDMLKKEGHRAKCRQCMEELEDMGLLDLEEEEFFSQFTELGIEENAFRYVIAYYMYQSGLDADYMAAWDLCRANQLYADFYICGYMTYEEAMDASLENSLILQQMYSSWEEMVDAYMLGYQFWQNDPCITDDSPTLERYRYYQMLLEIDDGPYTLDWDMKLEKSW